jgi:hypothetical protein
VLTLDGSSGAVIMIRTMREVVLSLLKLRLHKISMRRLRSLLSGDDGSQQRGSVCAVVCFRSLS